MVAQTAQTAQPGQERTFHLFSRLPAELRWKIWEHSLPGPRLVSIRCGSDDLGPLSSIPAPDGSARAHLSPCPNSSSSSSSSSCSSASSSFDCTSPARIPANLHASHESRREALRHYHAAFGLAHRPGRIFFSPESDMLYFGPRDGFMASEAQLRTVLTLCDPAELARVQKVAINDAVFWSGGDGRRRGASLAATATAGCADTTLKVAGSLLVDVLRLLRARLPGMRELVFVPRDENPLYSGDACLLEPAMAQSRLARVVREAMAVVFGERRRLLEERPWNWRIMTLSAAVHGPVYGREVLGWDYAGVQEDVEYGNVHGPGYGGPGWRGEKHWAGKDRELTRLSVLQESVRREFMHMEVSARAVPVLVE